ncbi:GxGYxYP domain-containing protein [Streptomyces sp. NPDC102340]|uniref:GxGYxYP domain-containing protein n=1 Tax=unclassified Streptomyces TaxID=2593676 RepID=UPI0037FB4B1D
MSLPHPSRRKMLGLLATSGAGAALAGAMPGTASAAAPPAGGLWWPRERILPGFAEPRALDVADLTTADADEQLLFATLQGNVNRSRPRIALLRESDEGATTWLKTAGLPFHTAGDPWSLLSKYRSEIRGVIVTDPAQPATVNLATTLAGLRNAVAASPDQLPKLTAAPYNLKVLDDLRDRFTDELSAYRWAVDNLWPHTSHRLLVGLDPSVGAYLRDYAVATRALVLWIHADQPDSRELGARVMSQMQAGSPYMGWFPSGVGGESDGTELTSEHGLVVLASDWSQNLTVFGGVRAPLARTQVTLPTPRLGNRIYVTFTMTEGDNLQYNQHRMRVLWDDPARGDVPINWSTTPVLADAAPTFLSYYQRTATRQDYLMAGPSGAGYAYPTPWPDDTFRVFTETSARYMRRTGLDSAVILNRKSGSDVPLTGAKARQYLHDVRPLGLLEEWTTRTEISALEGRVPLSVSYLTDSVADARDAIAKASADWDGTKPLFLSIGTLAWNLTPADVVTIVGSLDSRYQVVRGDQYFRLARKALNLPPG